MGLSASQGRMLLLTARKNDLEFQAQQISQRRLILAQQLEEISSAYQEATSNRQMKITLYDNGDAENGIRSTVNLDYASLVSGCYASGDTYDTGLQQSDRIRLSGKTASSNVAYRLVDNSGAIVISDLSEIPGTVTKSEKITATTGTNSSPSALTQCLQNKDNKNQNYKYAYGNNGLIRVTYETPKMTKDDNGNPVQEKDDNGNLVFEPVTKYFTKDGSEQTLSASQEFTEDPTIKPHQATVDGLPTVTYTISRSENTKVVHGGDNKYSLEDKDGVVLFRYVLDPTLAKGSTDKNGTTGDGPNYIQDCIRNGKYLLQKGGKDQDDGKYKWRDLSWDATANITDSYYTDDDEAAKAKYDRLQTQIQQQDKKLELELDNIETQRSAVTTEIESVQKVIDDNVEDSFKIFNA